MTGFWGEEGTREGGQGNVEIQAPQPFWGLGSLKVTKQG